MDDLLIDFGVVLLFALMAGIALSDLLASGRLEPRYGLSREAADLAKSVCVILFLPLCQGLLLFAPFPGGGSFIRRSVEFHIGTTALLGVIEVFAVIGTVRSVRRWRRSRPDSKS